MGILRAVVSKPVAVIGASLGALALAVSIIAPPASAATSIWQFSQGSYAIAESSGAGNATISIVNLRVWDGTVATGYVRVNSSISGRTYACSSQAFTGTTVTFLPGPSSPAPGPSPSLLIPLRGSCPPRLH